MASPSPEQIEELSNKLKKQGYPFIPEWLEQCTKWVYSEHPPNSLNTPGFVLNEILTQWKDTDLHELGSQCLPPDLGNVKLYQLTGSYVLQINSVQDISEGAYSQYNKICKLENENTTVEAFDSTEFRASGTPKSKRTLYLTLTDGTQIIYGLEMVPISTLSLNMRPGTKIKIKGPIDCRRGVLHLKPANIQIIGGEVEGLEQFGVENVLKNRLTDLRGGGAVDVPDGQDIPIPPPKIYNHVPPPSAGTGISNNRRPGAGTGPAISIHELPTQAIIPTTNGIQGGDDEFGDSDDELLMEIDELDFVQSATQSQSQTARPPPLPLPSNNISNSKSKPFIPPYQSKTTTFSQQNSGLHDPPVAKKPKVGRTPKNQRSSIEIIDVNDDNKKQKNILSYLKKPTPKKFPAGAKQSKPRAKKNTKTATATSTNGSDSFGDDDDDDILLLGIVEQAESQQQSVPAPVPGPSKKSTTAQKPKKNANSILSKSARPFQYIKQIQSNIFKSGSKVTIKAIISTLVSNIEVDKSSGNWKLKVNINDGSGYLIASISDQVLNRIIGFSPVEMKQIKASKTPDSKKRISNGMANITCTLVNFNGLMEITVIGSKNGNVTEYIITDMREITTDHVLELAERTQSLK